MQASIDQQLDEDRLLLRPLGEWVIDEVVALDQKLRDLLRSAAQRPKRMVIDLSAVDALDTAGAYLLAGLERRFKAGGGEVDWSGADPGASLFSTAFVPRWTTTRSRTGRRAPRCCRTSARPCFRCWRMSGGCSRSSAAPSSKR